MHFLTVTVRQGDSCLDLNPFFEVIDFGAEDSLGDRIVGYLLDGADVKLEAV